MNSKSTVEKKIRDIKRRIRKRYTTEEKILIVLEGIKGESTISELQSHHSIHSLRHTYATNLYRASGYNSRLVQKQLGHSNITTTTVYSDVISKDLEDAVENLK
jgi:site-specific recombinase XerD